MKSYRLSQGVKLRIKYKLAWKYQRTCVYCGAYCGDWRVFTLDHIQPLAKGGTSREENLALSCLACNAKKGSNWL